jgi:hypothetical protein
VPCQLPNKKKKTSIKNALTQVQTGKGNNTGESNAVWWCMLVATNKIGLYEHTILHFRIQFNICILV